jgi:hypothetical protein
MDLQLVLSFINTLNEFGKEYWGLLLVFLVFSKALTNVVNNIRRLRRVQAAHRARP